MGTISGAHAASSVRGRLEHCPEGLQGPSVLNWRCLPRAHGSSSCIFSSSRAHPGSLPAPRPLPFAGSAQSLRRAEQVPPFSEALSAPGEQLCSPASTSRPTVTLGRLFGGCSRVCRDDQQVLSLWEEQLCHLVAVGPPCTFGPSPGRCIHQ